MTGIEETIDIVQVVKTMAVEVAERVKDGVSPSDAVSLALDGDLREALVEAYQGANDVPGEIADLDMDEIEQLVDEAKSIPFAVLRELRT